ncbi:MAG TPA: alpha/beta hydrolase [Pirellulales bacterium]|jgi:endo-1,4-beta-xylanase
MRSSTTNNLNKPKTFVARMFALTAISAMAALVSPASADEWTKSQDTAAPISAAAPSDSSPQVVYLWPVGSPTLQGADEKEITTPPNPLPGRRIASIKNVHNPSIEVHLPPAEKANGCAIIVAPGGGHRELNVGTEGTDIAKWLNDLGIAAIILKYRLAQTPNYHYTVEGEALQDTQRAIRIVRAHAKDWSVNPERIGILGFSAGGALAALADIRFDRGNSASADPIDHESCRPDFVALVYAGWTPNMDITVPTDAAPAFLTSAGLDDLFHSKETVEFYQSLIKSQVPSELHIYGHGGHAGGINKRGGIPFGTWPRRFEEWLTDLGMMKKD